MSARKRRAIDVVVIPLDEAGPAGTEIGILRRFCDHYDRLADVTVFLSGDAAATQPAIAERLTNSPADFADLTFRAFGKELRVEDFSERPCRERHALAQLCTDWPCTTPEIVSWRPGSMFAVGRKQVTRRSRAVYEKTLRRARSNPRAAGVLESLWQILFAPSASRQGIVTAGDSAIYRDLQFLLRSLAPHNQLPIVVYDLGLATHELEWCLSQPNVTCRPIPTMTKAMARYVGSHRWQAWLKPTYIADAPFDRILWIDADCVVLDSVEDAFARIESGPFLLPEVAPGSGRNHPRLYELLPVADAGKLQSIEINNGVIGLDRHRDRALLDAWLYAVEWAIKNEGRRHLMRWYDQGALLWAILRTRQQEHIATDQSWNFPANPITDILRQAARNQRSVIDAIRATHPQARLVHWFGLNKLSVALDNEIREIFAAR